MGKSFLWRVPPRQRKRWFLCALCDSVVKNLFWRRVRIYDAVFIYFPFNRLCYRNLSSGELADDLHDFIVQSLQPSPCAPLRHAGFPFIFRSQQLPSSPVFAPWFHCAGSCYCGRGSSVLCSWPRSFGDG